MRAAFLAAALVAPAASAQPADHAHMAGMAMPGMPMPASPRAKATPKGKASGRHGTHRPAAQAHATPLKDGGGMPAMHHGGMAHDAMPATGAAAMDHMDHGTMPSMGTMPGMGDAAMKTAPDGAVKAVTGTAAAPPPPRNHAADRVWGAYAMRRPRAQARAEQGGQTFSMMLFNLAEYQVRGGGDGYRWDGAGWYGGDINRLVLKTEGEGGVRRGVSAAELQALYSRTVGAYWNLQAGVRHDVRPQPSRTYATIGVEGLAPNNFDLEAAAFLSDRGDLLGRLEGYYDQRLTQRLILQPRAELNLSAQRMPREGYGAGLVDAELGLRLRYEIRREFAPYLGVSWERRYGATRRFARARGEDGGGVAFVTGIRTWF